MRRRDAGRRGEAVWAMIFSLETAKSAHGGGARVIMPLEFLGFVR